ncbi:MAG: hypothetical protein M1479_08720 [Actinobacteria bacterium]|nr:hypothetical protein [Actinomycetota bacterium]
MNWITLKKGGVNIFVEYNKTFSSNLFAYNTQISVKPEFTIRFDLSPNLKTKNKFTNTYLDAKELVEGEIKELTLLQINDNTILKLMGKILKLENSIPDIWNLIIELEGEHSFKVTPKYQRIVNSRALFLHVK